MKEFFAVVLAVLLVVGTPALSFAAQDTATTTDDVKNYRLDVGNKFARGAKNVILGWTELPRRIIDVSRESNNVIWGLLAGTFQGAIKAFIKTASGAVDIITAPLDPEGAPFISPEIDMG